jgi:hypothetical protein
MDINTPVTLQVPRNDFGMPVLRTTPTPTPTTILEYGALFGTTSGSINILAADDTVTGSVANAQATATTTIGSANYTGASGNFTNNGAAVGDKLATLTDAVAPLTTYANEVTTVYIPAVNDITLSLSTGDLTGTTLATNIGITNTAIGTLDTALSAIDTALGTTKPVAPGSITVTRIAEITGYMDEIFNPRLEIENAYPHLYPSLPNETVYFGVIA